MHFSHSFDNFGSVHNVIPVVMIISRCDFIWFEGNFISRIRLKRTSLGIITEILLESDSPRGNIWFSEFSKKKKIDLNWIVTTSVDQIFGTRIIFKIDNSDGRQWFSLSVNLSVRNGENHQRWYKWNVLMLRQSCRNKRNNCHWKSFFV